MAFNWFKRQSSGTSATPAESTESSVEQSPPDSKPESNLPAEATEAPAIAQDYLSWAKAAYQNIQKRQIDASPTADAPPAVEATPITESAPPDEVETSVAEMPTVAESEVDTIVPVAISAPPAEPPSAPALIIPDVIESPVVLSPADETEGAIANVAPAAQPAVEATPLPFWAMAEAERQERLERLKAEAEAEVEQLSPPTATLSSTVPTSLPEPNLIPEMPLDEGFIWSAQVLAAQGRRPDQIDIEEITWLKRLRQGLDKTRRSLINQLRAIVGQGPLNQDAVSEIESLLLQADVGVEATDHIIHSLQTKLRQDTLPPEQAIAYLKQLLRDMLDHPGGKPVNPTFAPEKDTLNIWLITGVNGVGKTTTIGKIAHIAQKSGYRCLIGAADTFRAAAVQQVKVWGDRSNVDVIANPAKNADPAAVVFDAITAAQARSSELLLVDTAGRLQNKKNLMDELGKIRRIIDKKAPNAKVESLLVLDSSLGQNGLRQAEVFSEVAQLTGVVLTKLDGTAKGGIALAIVQQLGLPIRFIGAGEGIEDLRPFSSYEFVEALLSG